MYIWAEYAILVLFAGSVEERNALKNSQQEKGGIASVAVNFLF